MQVLENPKIKKDAQEIKNNNHYIFKIIICSEIVWKNCETT